MRILYLDCGMGAAGDMLGAALLELLPDKKSFLDKVNALGIPGVIVFMEDSIKCGIHGTHLSVQVNGQFENTGMPISPVPQASMPQSSIPQDDLQDLAAYTPYGIGMPSTHEHIHAASHHGSQLDNIIKLIQSLNLSDGVKEDITTVYHLIAQAESQVHRVPVSEIHFHEIGTMDAIADITIVCMLMEELGIQKVYASPIQVGYGQIQCAHGILPVPAPATACILKDTPIYSGDIYGELCTPTGAALLKYFVSEFGAMPAMKPTAIGYGMGVKDFPKANCLRAFLGDLEEAPEDGSDGADYLDDDESFLAEGGILRDGTPVLVTELCCNLDDMTPEKIGFAQEMLLSEGALDVYTTAVGMKKSRPGVLLTVLCRMNDKEDMIRAIFRYTTTLGIRETVFRRHVLERKIETVQTKYGNMRKKTASGYGVVREKYEYDDLADAAEMEGCSIDDIRNELR